MLDFGPRWNVYREIRYGVDEAFARLELAPEFHGEIKQFDLHPALLDMATGFGLPLLPDYTDDSPLYVPASCGAVRVWRPLCPHVFCHLRLSGVANSERDGTATFDIAIADADGRVLIEVDRLVMQRLASTHHFGRLAPPNSTVGRRGSESAIRFAESYMAGIRPDEGASVFCRILASKAGSQLMVSSIDLDTLSAHAERSEPDKVEVDALFERPSLESDFQAPRNPARIATS